MTTPKRPNKSRKADKLIRQMDFWRYIVAKDKYWYGIIEGYFDAKGKLLFWASEFEKPQCQLDEGINVLDEVLNMMKKDIQFCKGKVLDLTKSDKKAKEEYNGLSNSPG
jgi:hypothetical protein